jgi:hypothetical protein
MWSKFFGRRAFLGGAGAAIFLPALPSLLGRSARAQDAANPPQRFVAWMLPNGVPIGKTVGNFWRPSGLGDTFELSRCLEPLASVKSEVLFVSGLTNLVTYEPGAHASGAASFLTCTRIEHTVDTAAMKNGLSVDQLLAQRLKPGTRHPALAIDLAPGTGVGDCDFGLSCSYMFNVSWQSTTTPAPKLVDARSLFNALFDGFDPGASEAEARKRALCRKSVLDYALEDAQSLAPRLGASDRIKLDQYLTSVREVEQRMSSVSLPAACTVPPEPAAQIPLQERGPLMVDLQVLAMQCDRTRFMTFKLGSGFNSDDRDFGFLGLSNTHHTYSHHQNSMDNLEMCVRVVRWEVELLARLLTRMRDITEADGTTLLDNAAVYASSEVSDPDAHSLEDFTALLAGRCQGAFRPGRHLEFPGAPVGNLFLSVLRAFGVEDATFGETGTAPLSGLG